MGEPGKLPMCLIEVQTGKYFGEMTIIARRLYMHAGIGGWP